jgi:nucleoside-diphosphate-sugar epimerase
MSETVNDRRVLVTGGAGFIGTNLVQRLRDAGAATLVLDPKPPFDRAAAPDWLPVDVLDTSGLNDAFERFAPTEVVHLAAEVSVDPTLTVADYKVNVDGTANLLRAVAAHPTVDRLVVTSTQFVCRAGHVPVDDLDTDPDTVYGHTKVATENLTRTLGAGTATWTIIRPTTIWGPWDTRYRGSLYGLLKRGWYVHPDVGPCMRSYGYVGNVCWQIEQILAADPELVAGRTLYVGDRPIDIRRYAEAMVREVNGTPMRTVPARLGHLAARIGDTVGKVGIGFPVTSQRFASMTNDYPVPIEPTFELLGEVPYSLEDGVRATADWLRAQWARGS